jgi:hypothetical protein
MTWSARRSSGAPAILPSCFELTRQHRHQRIVTQFVVVVQILVAKRDPEHTLTDQVTTSCSMNSGHRAA